MAFLVGSLASLCNIAIHACVMTVVVRAAQAAAQKFRGGRSLLLVAVMAAVVSVLMAAHASEVVVWAITYFLVGAAPAGADLVYFAGVNFTTLGYGDVVPVGKWRILGPMTAMNGVLLFGWSVAVIFEVLHKALQLADRDGPSKPAI
jgi:hypothetical protein